MRNVRVLEEDEWWKFADWLYPPPLRLSAHLPLAGKGLLLLCRSLLLDDNPSGASRPFAQGSHWAGLIGRIVGGSFGCRFELLWGLGGRKVPEP